MTLITANIFLDSLKNVIPRLLLVKHSMSKERGDLRDAHMEGALTFFRRRPKSAAARSWTTPPGQRRRVAPGPAPGLQSQTRAVGAGRAAPEP